MARSFVGFLLAALLGATGFDWWLNLRRPPTQPGSPQATLAPARSGYGSMEGGYGYPPPHP
jgi:hypothetical protein